MKVLLLEDDESCASALARAFEEHKLALELRGLGPRSERVSPDCDLILIGAGVPEPRRSAVAKMFSAAAGRAPVVLLTAEEREGAFAHTAVSEGYQTSRVFLENMRRVQGALTRAQQLLWRHLIFEDLEMDVCSREVWRSGTPIELRRGDRPVLEVLLRHPGEILLQSFIGRQAWPKRTVKERGIVSDCIKRLQEKVDEPFSRKLIHEVQADAYALR